MSRQLVASSRVGAPARIGSDLGTDQSQRLKAAQCCKRGRYPFTRSDRQQFVELRFETGVAS